MEKRNLLDQYSLIILSGWANPPTVLQEVSDYAWQRSIPLFYVRSLGFFSEFSLQLPSQFPIVDTHPDPASTEDLRLLQPWSELSDHARLKTDNLDNLDDHTHGHIPYVLLLLHYLDVYKSSHHGKSPATYAEKKDFQKLVRSGARTNNAEGGEENYDQAVTSVLKTLNPPSITRGLQETFDDEDCKSPRSDVRLVDILVESWLTIHFTVGQFLDYCQRITRILFKPRGTTTPRSTAGYESAISRLYRTAEYL